ncbi:MAG: type III-B CRISPR-associated protein Cas10/Cmr2 [Chloroflexota bacterium]|nr:type III-B CRISPR-associated protein Cas10/Cmr2 [Chloroflexota bacterium]
MDKTNSYLFVCAIGPVQDFIATARTSHDLEFGSWLLSELSKAGARELSAAPQQLIFPAPGQNLERGSKLSVANKIIAVIEDSPGKIGTNVKRAVEQRLTHIYRETYKKFKGRIDRELAEEQLRDLLEFYWVSVPYPDEREYKLVRAQAEALLAARKNTRDFEPHNGPEGLPKSSLDGVRESVLQDTAKSLGGEDAFYDAYHAGQGEILSGVDLLKRWGKNELRDFESTTDLAAVPFLIKLGEKKESLVQDIRTMLAGYTSQPETEGAMVYVERLVQLIADKDKRGEFRKQFVKIFKNEGINYRPSPYYALLLADGDNMGKLLDAQDSMEKHQDFSRKLSAFAQRAKSIIKNHGGVPVYVGGDDVMTYLPLHTALKCISALNTEFSQAMQVFSFSDDERRHLPSLSGGLIIAHHLTPLNNVLDLARQAEKQAKSVPGKNALVVISSKRGGVNRIASAKLNALIERMEVLIEYARQKQISTGTAYELQKLHQELSHTALSPEAFQREALRIIQRKHKGGSEREVQQEVRQKFEAWFKDKELALDELAQEMIIAGEFVGAYDMADIAMVEKEVQV